MSNLSDSNNSTPEIQEMRLANDLFEAVRKGWKTATVRMGVRDVKEGPMTFVGAQDPSVRHTVNVLAALSLRLGDLPDEVTQLDGAENAAGMIAVLERHYPDVTLDSVVTAVLFESSEASD